MLFMKKLIINLIITQLLIQTYSYAQETPDSNKPKDHIKAKIGIRLQDKNGLRKAKAIDKISVGDKLSIYVKPWKDSLLYSVSKTSSELGTSTMISPPPYSKEDKAFKVSLGSGRCSNT